jgi:hypothetical protein
MAAHEAGGQRGAVHLGRSDHVRRSAVFAGDRGANSRRPQYRDLYESRRYLSDLGSEDDSRSAASQGELALPAERTPLQAVARVESLSRGLQQRHDQTIGSGCSPRKGYICLESEGSECHFRNIRIRELPSTNPTPEETALEAQGFVPLYTGVDLRGWRTELGHQDHWAPKDWILDYDGQSSAPDKSLWTEKEYGDFELVCDWRLTGKPKKALRPIILPSGEEDRDENGQPKMMEVDDAGDSGIYLRGSPDAQVNIWCWPVGSGEVWGYRTKKDMPPEVRAACTPKVRADNPPGKWNRFVIRMVGDRLTVTLNGQTVIENAQLPGVPERGPIALQHHGDPVQFANLFIRELKPEQPAVDEEDPK